MALYIPQSILHLARSLYVRPETYGPNYVFAVTELGLYRAFLVTKISVYSTDLAAVDSHFLLFC